MTERERVLAGLEGFASWADVLAHVAAGGRVYYHAPMDYLPRVVTCHVRGKSVRVDAPSRDCDPFTADAGHLSRFLKRKPSQTG